MRHTLLVFLVFYISITSAVAQLNLSDIFSDNMVLQRNRPIQFWGKGMPETMVKVKFANKSNKTRVKKDSTWYIFFSKQIANSSPQSIIIESESNEILLKNILIGDVWLCIGQSNMEWPMAKEMHFEQEKKYANQPLLRFHNPTYAGKGIFNKSFTDSVLKLLERRDFYKGNWVESDSHTIRQMSAVGYYFGKELLESEHVPIGLINMSIGGAPIETFIGQDAMASNPRFSKKVKGNWLHNDALPVWIRERGQQNVGKIKMIHKDELGPNHAFKPGFAYSTGLEPLFKMPIKGTIWYQGESNAQEIERVKEYTELQKLMIKDYRKQWKQPEMPFYWVQLSSIDSTHYNSKYWPVFRNEQRIMINEIEHGGMAVSSDIGAKNDVHPTNKRDVGKRLARWALHKPYAKKVVPSGPLPKEATYKNGKVIIAFNYTANGLKTSENKIVRGFSVDGKHDVPATLKGNTVEIRSRNKPEFVYYGWQPYTKANLVNSENLPASTFRLEVN